MGARSMKDSTSWRLKKPIAIHTQGLVASHFAHLPASCILFLQLPTDAGGAWLGKLRSAIPISHAAGSSEDSSAAAIAFTYSGLIELGLPDDSLKSFARPFREGMHQIDRKRRLGDSQDPDVGNEIAGGSRWSANCADLVSTKIDSTVETTITVHVALMLYALDEVALGALSSTARELLEVDGIKVVHKQLLWQKPDSSEVNREHFGFADGMSQPIPTGDAIELPDNPNMADQLHWHGVPAGEILLGHQNAHSEYAAGPVVAKSQVTHPGLLSDKGVVPDNWNLGLNGSYLVIRELRQDVAAFWKCMEAAAKSVNRPGVDAKWLAERMIGRTLNGDTLVHGVPPMAQGSAVGNSFGYANTDMHGMGCPLGAHVRRANPRDSRPSRDGEHSNTADSAELLRSANAHRILRRGRKYGTTLNNRFEDDHKERGLMFMCLATDLERQFEFVQEHWLLNPNFATLEGETDPLLGPPIRTPNQVPGLTPNRMTIPACPLRFRPPMASYIQLAGGDYFFLPSLPALDYFSTLKSVCKS